MALWADGPAETREPGVLFAAASGKGASWESKWKIGLKMSGLTPNVRLSPPGLMLKAMEHCTADS